MKKLLVANRSEIAIRCFRAATELGLRTVAVYSHEDRFSLHRFKADEAFLIGPPGGGEPVRSYLNIEGLIAVAQLHGADPGSCLAIEDSRFGIESAKSAGLWCVGITTTYPVSELMAADAIITSLDELTPELIRSFRTG